MGVSAKRLIIFPLLCLTFFFQNVRADTGTDAFSQAGLKISGSDRLGRVTYSDGSNSVIVCIGMSTALVNGRAVHADQFVTARENAIDVPEDMALAIRGLLDSGKKSSLATVIIDAGHGGRDPGAVGPTGLNEKDVNLAVALRLEKLLERRGIEVRMTRRTDTFIELNERVIICNRTRPDLFISIHANASESRTARGVETYYPRESLDDMARARTALRSGGNTVDGINVGDSQNLGIAIYHAIFDMGRKESVRIGRAVQQTLGNKLQDEDRGLRGAGYRVLKGAECPALLLEIGFISNPETERKFRDPRYLDKVAEAISSAL